MRRRNSGFLSFLKGIFFLGVPQEVQSSTLDCSAISNSSIPLIKIPLIEQKNQQVYDQLGNVICHGKRSVIDEGHKSFPSGHTSWSFTGLGFLSLYLAGKIKAFDRKGHVAKLCIIFLPLLVASLVGISRVDDYWHHWQDVFAGGLLGITVAGLCYLQFFPPPYHAQGWGPYAYFEELELSRNAQAANAADVPDAQAMETQNESHLDEQSGIGCMGLTLSPTPDQSPQDMESGGR
ncbi:hypothetical protein BT93_J0966 [Corymbia citriodora subsp. variegata]|nr:hypothetical protein BT93_J0966 [Corymbia citriodora subsp. variegata]